MAGRVSQQLRLYPMDTGRLLQGLNDVLNHLRLDPGSVAATRRDKQVAHHPFAAFVDEERIANNAASLHRGVARQDLRIHVAQDHFRRAAIIPTQQAAPCLNFFVEQRAQVGRREMPEIENLHGSYLMRTAKYGCGHMRVVQGR